MTSAPRTDPELIGRPRLVRPWILHLHFRAAALTANVVRDLGHGRDSNASRRDFGSTIRGMIPAIVLAAGKSTRMGRPKALLPLGTGETFVTRLVATLGAAGVDDVVVVAGHEAAAIVEAIERLKV